MRKLQIALVAVMLAGGSTLAAAQEAQPQSAPRPGGRGNQIAMLLQGITLTAEQQAKVDSLTKKFAAEREAMMADLQSADMETRRAKMRETMTKNADLIKALLTDDQKKVFEKNQTDMEARRQGGGRPPR